MTNEQLIVLLDQILENLNRIYDEMADKIHENFKCDSPKPENWNFAESWEDWCVSKTILALKRYINSLTVDKQRLSGTLHD